MIMLADLMSHSHKVLTVLTVHADDLLCFIRLNYVRAQVVVGISEET